MTTTRAGMASTALAIGLSALLIGCDDGSATGTGGAGAGTAGGTTTGQAAGGTTAQPANPIDKLADDPKSLYGRSAGYARDVAEKASQSGAEATGIANELGGGGGAVEAGGLTWTAPAAWAPETPSNDVRKAQFSVPGGATIYWSAFSGGGSVQANIDRWANEVLTTSGSPGEPTVNELTVSGIPVTVVALEGTYLDGPPGGTRVERRRWGMRGAIIEGPSGMVFIKMVGPKAAVSGAAGAFDAMLKSMKE